MKKNYEYIIVGSGPGGAPLARELAFAGKKVLIVERGKRHEKGLGFPFGPRVLEGAGFLCRSVEGVYIARGITLGGSSLVYNANVFEPPKRLFKEMGIDFSKEVKDIKNEIGVNTLPDRFFENATGTGKLIEAADSLGLNFRAQEKFIDPDKCRVGCDWCMLGCPRGAKWTTRVFIDQAVQKGADLLISSAVDKVVINKGRAEGIKLKNGRIIYGEKIILSAGGIGSAAILLRSGIEKAGKNFYMDPMDVVIGYNKDLEGGGWGEMTFTHAIEDFGPSEGFIIGNLSAPGVLFTGLMRANILRHNIARLPKAGKAIGLFVKLADSHKGEIVSDRKIRKPLTDQDNKNMKKGTDMAGDILKKAGVVPDSIAIGKGIGGHPGGTAAMGKIVNTDFETETENLYVCDGSVIPYSPGVPPSLTIMGMSKYFSKKLLAA